MSTLRYRAIFLVLLFLVVPAALLSAEVQKGSGTGYVLGGRANQLKKVMITGIRSNKLRYDENENATTKATIVNTDNIEHKGKLIAVMHLDLDTEREVGRTDFAIAAGKTKAWEFPYNVGPETYGRGIEVRFEDEKGALIDQWQEFYAVAAEYFRVQNQNHPGPAKNYKGDLWTTYFNQWHYTVGCEPTEFGVCTPDAEVYMAGGSGWRINWRDRDQDIAQRLRPAGIAVTFYTNHAFSGQMGYEEIRQHPEYALYDVNGRLAVDPVYGGDPNPIELASPMEVGPNRKVDKDKPYLDRIYQPWQHVVANLASEEAVTYGANCIKEYSKAHGFDGVYWDGWVGVLKGYSYDGRQNVPSDSYEDYVRINARNHRIYSEILKKDNPNFGTWFNGSMESSDYSATMTFNKQHLGMGGTKHDPRDDTIRAMTSWKNVMFLNEEQQLRGDPETMLKRLLRNRDKFVQELGANVTIGYFQSGIMGFPADTDAPGVNLWGWPIVNYFTSLIMATQHRFVGGFVPSMRPALQFLTRYSRFIWAPDIKVVPEPEIDKKLSVSGSEEVWWKQFVYQRKTDTGYDLILHLVRKPPAAQWDVNWLDDPIPLEEIRISIKPGAGKVEKVLALRPYYFEEEQQSVETVVKAEVKGQETVMTVPSFRYHTMVVVRIKE